MWIVVLTNTAEKEIARLPKQDLNRIVSAIETIKTNPFLGDITKITAEKWRKRVGSYRIFFKIAKEKKLVYVVAIKRRTSTTYS